MESKRDSDYRYPNNRNFIFFNWLGYILIRISFLIPKFKVFIHLKNYYGSINAIRKLHHNKITNTYKQIFCLPSPKRVDRSVFTSETVNHLLLARILLLFCSLLVFIFFKLSLSRFVCYLFTISKNNIFIVLYRKIIKCV